MSQFEKIVDYAKSLGHKKDCELKWKSLCESSTLPECTCGYQEFIKELEKEKSKVDDLINTLMLIEAGQCCTLDQELVEDTLKDYRSE